MKNKGFTLAELLIALAILGVIATFTIPKVLSSSSSSQNTAIAKEAASIVSGSFAAFDLEGDVSATTTAAQLTPFINYVRVDTSNTNQSGLAENCVAATPCLMLHNGGTLQYVAAGNFNADANGSITSGTDAILFNVDPDSDSASAGPVTFVLFSNGRLSTGQHAGTYSATAGLTAVTTDPTYIATWN